MCPISINVNVFKPDHWAGHLARKAAGQTGDIRTIVLWRVQRDDVIIYGALWEVPLSLPSLQDGPAEGVLLHLGARATKLHERCLYRKNWMEFKFELIILQSVLIWFHMILLSNLSHWNCEPNLCSMARSSLQVALCLGQDKHLGLAKPTSVRSSQILCKGNTCKHWGTDSESPSSNPPTPENKLSTFSLSPWRNGNGKKNRTRSWNNQTERKNPN